MCHSSSHYILVSVRFELWRYQPTTGPTLASAISLLPTARLEELRLDGDITPFGSIRLALSELVQRFNTCFKQVSTRSSLTDAAWELLASLDTPSTEISKSIPHEHTFPGLKRLRVVVNNVRQDWPLLFPLLESSPLEQVTVIGARGIQYGDVPSQVAFAILKIGLQRSLGALTFTGFDPSHLTFISHVGPFSSLTILECITLCWGSWQCVCPLTDPDIEQLASALPQLVTLCLGHRCGYTHYHTTIKSMISLSTHCPSLEHLLLPCDLSNISEDAKMESGEPDPRLGIQGHCALKCLLFQCVIMPPLEDIEASRIAASAMRHLFPRLGPIEG